MVIRARTIRHILLLLIISFVFPLSAFADHANVFVYHRFNDSRYPSTNISSQDFRRHLEILKKNDYSVLTLGEIVSALREGRPLPERCAAISVDDAFRSFLTDGWPLLKAFGYPATLFVSTDTVGSGDYLSWNDIRRLVSEGVEVGNHSAAHLYMLDFDDAPEWSETIIKDLDKSQAIFREQLGKAPEVFAYPYGEFSPALIDLVRQEGFVAAFAQQSGVVSPGQDIYILPRFPMGGGFVTSSAFRSKLFMKHLSVDIVSSKSPVLKGDNPPRFRFRINSDDVSESTLSCYIPGQDKCHIDLVPGGDGVYEIKAENAITDRRSKYTITASDELGRNWYWFSQPWVLPRR